MLINILLKLHNIYNLSKKRYFLYLIITYFKSYSSYLQQYKLCSKLLNHQSNQYSSLFYQFINTVKLISTKSL
jgi:hypothetical protein